MTTIAVMYDFEDFQSQQVAYESFAKLMAEASHVRTLFDSAGLPIPPALARFLGIDIQHDSSPKRLVIPSPKSPPRPMEAKDDWVWIKIANMTAYSLTLALLRENKSPMSPSAIVAEIKKYLPDVNPRSVYNLKPPRLKGATNTNGKWELSDVLMAPILHGGYAWGPPSVFLPQEMTFHRRSLILHLLRSSADGLMAMQMVRQLQESELCKTTVNKDLVKSDIEVLRSENEIKRIGRTKKWTATNDWDRESKYA